MLSLGKGLLIWIVVAFVVVGGWSQIVGWMKQSKIQGRADILNTLRDLDPKLTAVVTLLLDRHGQFDAPFDAERVVGEIMMIDYRSGASILDQPYEAMLIRIRNAYRDRMTGHTRREAG